jgi:outer membrane immunogenic protein
VQVGCDYQLGSNWVIGAFADYDFSGLKGDLSTAALGWVGSQKLKSSWAAGGRIGWLPFQRLLVFVSGGYVQTRANEVRLFTATGIDTGFSLAKHTYDGWFVGSGYEYGIGWLPGLFWKTEYRFADYGSDRVTLLAGGVPGGSFIGSHLYVHTVRSELVWRFNFGGPVVARY